MGRLRETESESHLHGSLNYFYGTFHLVFLWLIILICLVHSPHLVYLRILLYVHMLSLSQDRFYQKGLWVKHPFSLNSREPFCTCVVREVSWLWEWEIMWSGQGPASSPNCPAQLWVTVHRGWISSCFTWGVNLLPASPLIPKLLISVRGNTLTETALPGQAP